MGNEARKIIEADFKEGSQRQSLRVWQEREDEHRETLRRLHADIEAKQSELDALNVQVGLRDSLVTEIEGLEKILVEIRDRHQEARARTHEAKESLARLRHDCQLAEETRSQEEKRSREVQTEVEHLRHTADLVSVRISHLKSEESRLNVVIGQQQEQDSQYETRRQQQRSDTERAQQELDVLRGQIREQAEKLDSVEQAVNAEEQNRVLLKQAREGLERELEEKRRQLGAEDERLSASRENYEKTRALQQECERRLETTRADTARLSVVLGEKNAELIHLRDEREGMLSEVRDLKDRKSALMADTQQVQAELRELGELRSGVQQTISDLELVRTASVSQNEELGREQKRLRLECEALAANRAHLDGNVIALKEGKLQLTIDKKLIEDEVARARQALEFLQKEVAQAEERVAELREQIMLQQRQEQTLRQTTSTMEERYAASEQSCRLSESKLESAEERLRSLESNVKSKQGQLRSLEMETQNAERTLHDLRARRNQLEQEAQGFLVQRTREESTLMNLKDQCQDSEKALGEIAKLADGERMRFAAEHERANQAREQSERNHARLEEIIKSLQGVAGERDRAQIELVDLRRTALAKTEELSELESLRQDKLARLSELKAEIQGIKKEKLKHEQFLKQTLVKQRSLETRHSLQGLRDQLAKLPDDEE